MQCKQAHNYAHIKCNQTKVHELAPPTYVLLLSKNFDPSHFLNVAPFCPLSMSKPQSFPKLSYLCIISSPLSLIFIKGVLLIDAKASIGVDG
jgi:hypothetical protein